MDNIVNLWSKVIHYCHRKDIPIEKEESIKLMVHESRKLLNGLSRISPPEFPQSRNPPTDFQQRNKTTNEETEPSFAY